LIAEQRARVTHHTLIAAGFPVELWNEWKTHCKDSHNDNYWVKIWEDHLKAKAYDAEKRIQHGNIHS